MKVIVNVDNFMDKETKEIIKKGKVWESTEARCNFALEQGYAIPYEEKKTELEPAEQGFKKSIKK